jgi:hypothetical protein
MDTSRLAPPRLEDRSPSPSASLRSACLLRKWSIDEANGIWSENIDLKHKEK